MSVLKVKKNGQWVEVFGALVDPTLSYVGMAADAKAVGDALADKQPVGDYALRTYVDDAIEAAIGAAISASY